MRFAEHQLDHFEYRGQKPELSRAYYTPSTCRPPSARAADASILLNTSGGELVLKQFRGCGLPHPGHEAAGLGRMTADPFLDAAVSLAAAELADVARCMCVVTMLVNVAPPAAAEALLHARRIGVAKVGQLVGCGTGRRTTG